MRLLATWAATQDAEAAHASTRDVDDGDQPWVWTAAKAMGGTCQCANHPSHAGELVRTSFPSRMLC
jgi:hypothetical protein